MNHNQPGDEFLEDFGGTRLEHGEFFDISKDLLNIFMGLRRIQVGKSGGEGVACASTMAIAEENRKMQVVIAAAILTTITLCAVTLLIGWHYVPGLLGEWLGVIAGLISTPFFMEGTFVILGIIIVYSLNQWRMRKDGDEFVYLEQVAGPDVPKNLPDQAKWAVYGKEPLPPVDVPLLAQAEGAVAIGDFESAAAVIASMNHDELAQEGVLEVRHALAVASGKVELAERLNRQIAERKEVR